MPIARRSGHTDTVRFDIILTVPEYAYASMSAHTIQLFFVLPPRRRFIDYNKTSDRFLPVCGFGNTTCSRMAHFCLPYVSHVCYSRQVRGLLRASKSSRRRYVIGRRDLLANPIVCACCCGPGWLDARQPRRPGLLRARFR